jgi:hypothetical protein
MLPTAVICDDCGAKARVRACGRVEYDWPELSTDGQVATMPTINSARLTIDCPNCGVKTQDVRFARLTRDSSNPAGQPSGNSRVSR